MLPQAKQTAQAKKKLGPKGPRRRMKPQPQRKKGLLSTRGVAEKFDVSMRTVERWEEFGILPKAKRIRTRRFWDEDVEPRTDKPAAADAAA